MADRSLLFSGTPTHMSSFPTQVLMAAAVAVAAVTVRPMGFTLDTFEFVLWYAEYTPHFFGASFLAAMCVRRELRVSAATLRQHFGPLLTCFSRLLRAMPPHTRRGIRSAARPCLLDADWCLRCDVTSDSWRPFSAVDGAVGAADAVLPDRVGTATSTSFWGAVSRITQLHTTHAYPAFPRDPPGMCSTSINLFLLFS